MKTKILKLISYSLLISGVWIFVTNTLDSGSDERVLAGMGSALIILYFFINEFWIMQVSNLKIIWKIITISLFITGIWLFVFGTLDSGSDERVIAGLGAALCCIAMLIKSNFETKTENSEYKMSKSLLIIIVFISIFTFWGLHHKEIRGMNYEINNAQRDIDDLEREVRNLEFYTHEH